MLIISKTRDYYDGVARQGVDKSIVYKRLEVVHEDALLLQRYGSFEFENTYTHRGVQVYEKGRKHIILFCGQLYNYYTAEYTTYNNDLEKTKNVTKIVVPTYDKVKEYARNYFGAPNPKRWHSWNSGVGKIGLVEEINRLDFDAMHRQYESPVLSIVNAPANRNHVKGYAPYDRQWFDVVANPNLGEAHFVNFVDPYSAHQEIAMYLSGVMGVGEAEIVTLTDKDKIAKHGMDKWSFRKMPQEK